MSSVYLRDYIHLYVGRLFWKYSHVTIIRMELWICSIASRYERKSPVSFMLSLKQGPRSLSLIPGRVSYLKYLKWSTPYPCLNHAIHLVHLLHNLGIHKRYISVCHATAPDTSTSVLHSSHSRGQVSCSFHLYGGCSKLAITHAHAPSGWGFQTCINCRGLHGWGFCSSGEVDYLAHTVQYCVIRWCCTEYSALHIPYL